MMNAEVFSKMLNYNVILMQLITQDLIEYTS
jgi:hypothetical protein